MKLLISGAGVAGALMIAGGTPIAGLSMSASPADSEAPPAAVQSAVNDDVESNIDATEATDVEATDPDETKPDETTTQTPTEETADTESSLEQQLGLAHAAAMKAWTQCVREAASGPKTEGQPIPPKNACPPKPLGPGQILQQLGLATDDDEADTDGTADTDETTDTDAADTDTDVEKSAAPSHASGHATSHGKSNGASHRHHGR